MNAFGATGGVETFQTFMAEGFNHNFVKRSFTLV
jgi:hypothetical protein